MKMFVAAALLSAALPVLAVTKCIGAGGKVTYTDDVCPAGTSSSKEVEGTTRRTDVDRSRANERSDISIQRDRIDAERDRVALEREKSTLKRDQHVMDRQTTEQCITARETLRHNDSYTYLSAMRQACGLDEPVAPTRVEFNPPAQASGGSYQPDVQSRCRSIDANIANLDAMSRQPQSASGQDWIRNQRKSARDEQFALRCR